VDASRCTLCGRCAEVCQFNALAVIGQNILLFQELCHGCGSCSLICPEQAISEKLRVMGRLEAGPAAGDIYLAQGWLNVGEPMAVPVIRHLKQWELAPLAGYPPGSAHNGREWPIVILDAPPGTSCPVVESMRGADFALLVTEPTAFGLHDLRLMVDVVRELKLPAGVVINRDGVGDAEVDEYCAEVGLPVLMRIPLEREIGAGLARGEPLVAVRPDYAPRFRELYGQIQAKVGQVAA
jgi:MinD superfamily P-loop ATPase